MTGAETRKAIRILAFLVLTAALVHFLTEPMVTKIVVSKSKRTLSAYAEGGRVLGVFPVLLGRQSAGTKEREGDERTPEGEYYVCFKNPESRYHLSLGLSYPNLADARRGLADGRISSAEYQAIAAAQAAKQIPPWKTELGGEIFIHGGVDGREATAGCIAISNQAIEQLFPEVELGTPVVIEP